MVQGQELGFGDSCLGFSLLAVSANRNSTISRHPSCLRARISIFLMLRRALLPLSMQTRVEGDGPSKRRGFQPGFRPADPPSFLRRTHEQPSKPEVL